LERGTARIPAEQGMQVRDLGGIITRLGEGVLQTIDLEIEVVATRGSKMSEKIRGIWTLGQKCAGIRVLEGMEGVGHLIASTSIEMDISKLPVQILPSAITARRMDTDPWYVQPKRA
jgi:hypothetical protein